MTEFFFWPKMDAWEQMNVALEAKDWITERCARPPPPPPPPTHSAAHRPCAYCFYRTGKTLLDDKAPHVKAHLTITVSRASHMRMQSCIMHVIRQSAHFE